MDDIVLPPLPAMPLFDPEKMWVWLDKIRNEAVIADRERRTAQPEPDIGDYDIDKIADSMPGGIDGFLKHWGWRQFARAIIEADRKRRAEPASKKVHQATICLDNLGDAWVYTGGSTTADRHIIRWTDDGRVWIESADHRRSAIELRRAALWLRSEDAHVFAAACARAANLLDGGQPC